MKARIEKKLSKKILHILPELFNSPWINSYEPSNLAFEQGSRVSGVWSVGGELDYWGEGTEVYTCYEWFLSFYSWLGDFPNYPDGHELEFFPDIGNFRPTGKNLLNLAKKHANEFQLRKG